MRATGRGRMDDLHGATSTGNIARGRTLLTHEADPGACRQGDSPPMDWAICHKRLRTVELLLDARADIELRDPDRGAAPFEYAIVYEGKRIIRLLMAHGADAKGGVAVALKGAGRGFEEFPGLPSRRKYAAALALLGELPAPPGSSVDPGTDQ